VKSTGTEDSANSVNALAAAFVQRNRRLRQVVIVAIAVAVCLIVALTIGSVWERRVAVSERTAGDMVRARLDSTTSVLIKAEWSYERALAVDEKALGPKHDDVARDLKSLATLYAATGRYLEAEQLMRRALSIDEQRFGPDHQRVAEDLVGLAGLCDNMGRFADAQPLYQRAREIQANLGKQHPGDEVQGHVNW
jgi:tetratricopeptide (TPR) repeat protein